MSATPPGHIGVAQAVALLATGAAAVSLVAGLGRYLYVRFTQQRRPPADGVASAGHPPAQERRTDR